jgi:hypothetical protein
MVNFVLMRVNVSRGFWAFLDGLALDHLRHPSSLDWDLHH